MNTQEFMALAQQILTDVFPDMHKDKYTEDFNSISFSDDDFRSVVAGGVVIPVASIDDIKKVVAIGFDVYGISGNIDDVIESRYENSYWDYKDDGTEVERTDTVKWVCFKTLGVGEVCVCLIYDTDAGSTRITDGTLDTQNGVMSYVYNCERPQNSEMGSVWYEWTGKIYRALRYY